MCHFAEHLQQWRNRVPRFGVATAGSSRHGTWPKTKSGRSQRWPDLASVILARACARRLVATTLALMAPAPAATTRSRAFRRAPGSDLTIKTRPSSGRSQASLRPVLGQYQAGFARVERTCVKAAVAAFPQGADGIAAPRKRPALSRAKIERVVETCKTCAL